MVELSYLVKSLAIMSIVLSTMSTGLGYAAKLLAGTSVSGIIYASFIATIAILLVILVYLLISKGNSGNKGLNLDFNFTVSGHVNSKNME